MEIKNQLSENAIELDRITSHLRKGNKPPLLEGSFKPQVRAYRICMSFRSVLSFSLKATATLS